MLRLLTHRYTLRVSLSALAVALLTAGLLTHRSTTGRPAPPLPSRALIGRPITLADLRGRAAVVVFWSPSCIPCHQEAPAIERFAQSPAGRGRIVAVDADYTGAWSAFVHAYHWSFPVLADPELSVTDAYRVLGLPTTVFLDPAGHIATVSPGPQTVTTLTKRLAAAA